MLAVEVEVEAPAGDAGRDEDVADGEGRRTGGSASSPAGGCQDWPRAGPWCRRLRTGARAAGETRMPGMVSQCPGAYPPLCIYILSGQYV